MSTLKISEPSVLAFERKLDTSDALFFAGDWEQRNEKTGWTPLVIREKAVRGTISNRLKSEKDSAKLNASIEKPNLQSVDVCTLPAEFDTLKVVFSLRILAGTGEPSACNESAYRAKLAEIVTAYKDKFHFSELGRRYAFNLANGRFLWRNRIGAEEINVQIEEIENGKTKNIWDFSALDISLREFSAPENAQKSINELGELIAKGLCGEHHILLQISAFVRIGKGLEVYPSQELILEQGAKKKSKTLYTVGKNAAMHSQKIGNALRTIDDWYPEAAENGPIAVEPYGAVTVQGKAYRQPKEKMDFYSIFDNWIIKDVLPAEKDQHFVMAILVRGGVFGKEKEGKEK